MFGFHGLRGVFHLEWFYDFKEEKSKQWVKSNLHVPETGDIILVDPSAKTQQYLKTSELDFYKYSNTYKEEQTN